MVYVRISACIVCMIILGLVYVFSDERKSRKAIIKAERNYKRNIARFNEDV